MPFLRILAIAVASATAACASSTPPPSNAPSNAKGSTTIARRTVDESTAKIVTFAVSPQNLAIDVISMREGVTTPDGNRDLVFTAELDGPMDALYLVACTEQGEPLPHFHADTVRGSEPLPPGLGSVVDTERMTEWIALREGGKFVNHENGRIGVGSGTHSVELFVPNTGMLRGQTHLRLYARLPSGALIAGPIASY